MTRTCSCWFTLEMIHQVLKHCTCCSLSLSFCPHVSRAPAGRCVVMRRGSVSRCSALWDCSGPRTPTVVSFQRREETQPACCQRTEWTVQMFVIFTMLNGTLCSTAKQQNTSLFSVKFWCFSCCCLWCVALATECSPSHFKCRSGRCVLATKRCDGHLDCDDHSDEDNCGETHTFQNKITHPVGL